jgi:hypothetical protein
MSNWLLQVVNVLGFSLPFYRSPTLLLSLGLSVRVLYYLITQRPDVIHVSSPGLLVFAATLYAKLLAIPLVVSSSARHVSFLLLAFLPEVEGEDAWYQRSTEHRHGVSCEASLHTIEGLWDSPAGRGEALSSCVGWTAETMRAVQVSYHTHIPEYIPKYTWKGLVGPMWRVIRFNILMADLTLVPSKTMKVHPSGQSALRIVWRAFCSRNQADPGFPRAGEGKRMHG